MKGKMLLLVIGYESQNLIFHRDRVSGNKIDKLEMSPFKAN